MWLPPSGPKQLDAKRNQEIKDMNNMEKVKEKKRRKRERKEGRKKTNRENRAKEKVNRVNAVSLSLRIAFVSFLESWFGRHLHTSGTTVGVRLFCPQVGCSAEPPTNPRPRF
jgi:hypothetical protein